MNYKLIVATDEKGGIGKDNKIPWHFSDDLEYFSKITKGEGKNSVIMGRKTWDSLPIKPLPGRANLVMSRSGYSKNYCDVLAGFYKDNWVIGGEQIYNLYLPEVCHIYLTKVKGDYNCDTFFNLDYLKENFELEKEISTEILTFCVYSRKQPR